MAKTLLNMLAIDSITPQEIYIDTSALRGMKVDKELAPLLHMSKAGTINVYIGETALWERSRQQHENDKNEIKNPNRLVPFPGIYQYVAWFKQLFEQYGVRIISSNDAITEKVREYLQRENTRFNSKDENDQRDAHVLATAELSLEKSCLILCNDINLVECFKIAGFFNVRQDYKAAVLELIGEEIPILFLERPSFDSLDVYQTSTPFTSSFCRFMQNADHRFNALPSITDKFSAKLANMQMFDAEIRKRILGYVMWFFPLKKTDLNKLLEPKGHSEVQINVNAQRLKQEDLIIETENNWFANIEQPEAREICEQAMAVIMPEILAIMELT